MTDGVTLNLATVTGGAVIDAELLPNTRYAQRVKFALGPVDTDAGDVSSTNPMPTSVATLPADISSVGNTLNSATLNAAYTLTLSNAAAVATYTVTGLTASGATLALEYNNDGGATAWAAENQLAGANGVLTNLLTTDSQFRVDVAGHRQVRLRVSAVGTGTVTVSSNVSTASGKVSLSSSIPGGTNTIGGILGRPALWTATPTVTLASAYAVDQCVGGLMTFTGALGTDLAAFLQSLLLSFGEAQTAPFAFILFNANPNSSGSVFTDKTTATLAAADRGKVLGAWLLAANSVLPMLGANVATYELDNIGKYVIAPSTTLYGAIVTGGAPTFTANPVLSGFAAEG